MDTQSQRQKHGHSFSRGKNTDIQSLGNNSGNSVSWQNHGNSILGKTQTQDIKHRHLVLEQKIWTLNRGAETRTLNLRAKNMNTRSRGKNKEI